MAARLNAGYALTMKPTPITTARSQSFSSASQSAAIFSLRQIGAAFAATRDELFRQAGLERSPLPVEPSPVQFVARDTRSDRGVIWMGAKLNSEMLFRMGCQLG